MQSIHEIRRANLARMIAERCENSQTKAAEILGYATPSIISRYITGNKNLGTNAARTIETALKYQENWMDNVHGDDAFVASNASVASPLDTDSRKILALLNALAPERRAALLRFLRAFAGAGEPVSRRRGTARAK